jgi:uncharacterized protein
MAIVKSLYRSFLQLRRSSSSMEAFMRGTAASRILLFPTQRRQIEGLAVMRKYCSDHDPFFFLTHNFYLSQKLTLAQRIACAIEHYGYEERNRRADYHDMVYGSPGLVLWQQEVEGTQYELRLAATDDNRYEGDLSVLLMVDDVRVCRMSFSYVDAQVFGLASDSAMFITRNQTDRNEQLNRFRATFKQNSPPYFCLAAMCGIAMANGMRALYAIKHDAQIAYEERYIAGFKNSYTDFWQQFGAEEVDHQAYRLEIPLRLAPLNEVKHKNRAVARRRNWTQIIHDTRETMIAHSTSQMPAPISEIVTPPEYLDHHQTDDVQRLAGLVGTFSMFALG